MGTITNSDLELAALLTGAHITTQHDAATPPILSCTVDNTSAWAWARRGSTSSNTTPAYLLHQFAQLCCSHDVSFNPVFTPGSTNAIADFCSQSFALLDDAFLSDLQRAFPVQSSWTLAHPTSEWLLQMNSALFRTMLCDETCDPLLDQGLVEVSGSLCFTYFCFRKVRPDSCSFKLSF